jgi:hypothetical protein
VDTSPSAPSPGWRALGVAAWALAGLAALSFSLSSAKVLHPLLIRQWEILNDFQAARCTIVSKELVETEDRRASHHSPRPEFVFQFEHEGASVRAAGYDGREWFFGMPSTAQNALARYRVGGTYPCWYDPDDTSTVALVRWQPFFVWSVIGTVLLPMLFGILALVATLLQVRPDRRGPVPVDLHELRPRRVFAQSFVLGVAGLLLLAWGTVLFLLTAHDDWTSDDRGSAVFSLLQAAMCAFAEYAAGSFLWVAWMARGVRATCTPEVLVHGETFTATFRVPAAWGKKFECVLRIEELLPGRFLPFQLPRRRYMSMLSTSTDVRDGVTEIVARGRIPDWERFGAPGRRMVSRIGLFRRGSASWPPWGPMWDLPVRASSI